MWFPRGGVHALPRALADAAVRAGVSIQYGVEVTGLQQRGGRITAVRTADESVTADAVISTAEPPETWRLLGQHTRKRSTWSHSAFVVHLGTDEPWSAAHHTISFGAAWSDTFRELRRGRLMSDPSLLVTRPTATDPDLAPAGRELHQVLAICPNTHASTIDWPQVGPAYQEELLTTLQRRGFGTPVGDIQPLSRTTPVDWSRQGFVAGTPFSAAHTFAQTGPFRVRNLVRSTENLVLAGSGTTPGVGVPPVLLSGKHAARRITGR